MPYRKCGYKNQYLFPFSGEIKGAKSDNENNMIVAIDIVQNMILSQAKIELKFTHANNAYSSSITEYFYLQRIMALKLHARDCGVREAVVALALRGIIFERLSCMMGYRSVKI